MKILHILLIFGLFYFCSCSHTPSASGPISIAQLKGQDLASVRPRLMLWLGTDKAGLDAITTIKTYEEFLYSLSIPDNKPKEPTEPQLPSSSALLQNLSRPDVIYPPPKNILNENLAASPLIQLARQRLRGWTEQLNNSYTEYHNSLDLRIAKKGAAAGYNALLSGPTMSDIPKISEKMKALLDSLYMRRKE